MHYIGLMSGTSVDGIDAAIVSFPLNAKPIVVSTYVHPLPPDIRDEIQSLMRTGPNEIERLGELDMALGELFAEAANAVLQQAGLVQNDIRAIGSHGQTLRHRPKALHPFTLQIGNPSVIAERTGITTVADFRARDIAAGGEGAPLVPAFHRYMFHSPQYNRTIVNIGGIANITYLAADPAQSVSGFDTGPGNTLLDQWISRHQGQTHDDSGKWAASGKLVPELLKQLLADAYFAMLPPKSTGREHFNLEWLDGHLKKFSQTLAPADIQATLLQLTAKTIAQAIHQFLPHTQEVYVCGGGAHNRELVTSLAKLFAMPVASTEALGLPPDWVEAVAFAWLAHQTMTKQPGNIPTVTGARRAAILGGIYQA